MIPRIYGGYFTDDRLQREREERENMSEGYTLTGTVKEVGDTQTFDSGFTKREFVVTTEARYPRDVPMACLKDNTALLARVNVGDRVTATFDVGGHEYNGRWYPDITCWQLDVDEADDIPYGPPDEPAGDAVEPDDDVDF